jgi:uncharacterized protein YcfJ
MPWIGQTIGRGLGEIAGGLAGGLIGQQEGGRKVGQDVGGWLGNFLPFAAGGKVQGERFDLVADSVASANARRMGVTPFRKAGGPQLLRRAKGGIVQVPPALVKA